MIDQVIIVVALSVLLLAAVIAYQLYRQIGAGTEQKSLAEIDNIDTLADWPPQATRIFSTSERNAYDLLVKALPNYTILGQVPLSRFIKVTSRHSYSQWLKRVGNHCVDLIVADNLSRVIAVIEIQSEKSPDTSTRKKARVARVLEAVRISVFEWIDGEFPSISEIRTLFRVPDPEFEALGATDVADQLPFSEQDPENVNFYIATEPLSDFSSPPDEAQATSESGTEMVFDNMEFPADAVDQLIPEGHSDKTIGHAAWSSIDLDLPDFFPSEISNVSDSTNPETSSSVTSHSYANSLTEEPASASSTDMLANAWLHNERQMVLFENMVHEETKGLLSPEALLTPSSTTTLKPAESLDLPSTASYIDLKSQPVPLSETVAVLNKKTDMEGHLDKKKMEASQPIHHRHPSTNAA